MKDPSNPLKQAGKQKLKELRAEAASLRANIRELEAEGLIADPNIGGHLAMLAALSNYFSKPIKKSACLTLVN